GHDRLQRQVKAAAMSSRSIVGAAGAVALVLGGYWLGTGGWRFAGTSKPIATTTAAAEEPASARKVLYWKDPDGRADFSPAPKKTPDGRDYLPVYEQEEPPIAASPVAKPKGRGKILYYRNPMGLPDTSPVPKKDWMGMDYIPVYAGEEQDGHTVKISPGRLQRTGVKTEVVGKSPLVQIIKAPGVVAFDETRLSVVAMRFDGYINKVMPVTSGTHVHKGQPLMSVFGQELLNAGVQIVLEEVTGWKGP